VLSEADTKHRHIELQIQVLRENAFGKVGPMKRNCAKQLMSKSRWPPKILYLVCAHLCSDQILYVVF